MEQQIPLPKQDYMVNISCMTYNHEDYIEEALKGFVMQKTNFPFCALVIDDASTDGTAEIIRQYEQKYPEIIKGVYLTENHYSIKKSKIPYYRPWRERSKYIALCEGDDYWTDPLKLQKQVDFLEANPEYVMCSHRFRLYMQENKEYTKGYDWNSESTNSLTYNLNSLISGKWYYQPLSVMFRFDKLDLQEYARYPYSMDSVLFFHLLKKGPGILFNEDMAVYRVHAGGVWSGINSNNQIKNEFNARIGIYEVEQSYEAALFLRNQFTKFISRKWMLQEWRLMMKSFKIISKHFGYIATFNLFAEKVFLNKNLRDKQ